MISPTDLLDPTPPLHFETFQVFLIYLPAKNFRNIPQRLQRGRVNE
jgi:hypothetical protein